MRKYPLIKNNDFLTQTNEFDTLFFGTSHVINAIYPNDLWKEFGLSSYNLGNHGETLKLTYYNIKIALEYNKPKSIVLDLYGTFRQDSLLTNKGKARVHDSLDAYQSYNDKIEVLRDFLGDKITLADIVEYVFPFSKYHSRWNELSMEDFSTITSIEKGAESRINVEKPSKKYIAEEQKLESYNEENIKYLNKIIGLCKNEGIDLLLIFLPTNDMPMSDFGQIVSPDYFAGLAEENGVDYVDFNKMELVDDDIDYYDDGQHLNPSGARKVTHFLGAYLMEHFELGEHSDSFKSKSLDVDYNKYIDLKVQNIRANAKDLKNSLILLYAEKDIDYTIYLPCLYNINQRTVLNKLLYNLDMEKVFICDKKSIDDLVIIKTIDRRNDTVIQEQRYYDVI